MEQKEPEIMKHANILMKQNENEPENGCRFEYKTAIKAYGY